jgi:chorismate dehydratase
MSALRIGAVSYLNTVPLVHELPRLSPTDELRLDLPSRLADRLGTGLLDVALIPVIEVALGEDYTIVSDACIGCCGPVWSVKLLSRRPLREIRSVALDEGSRTSVALTKLLLQRRLGLHPEYFPLPISSDYRLAETDAVLVIGDRAMHRSAPSILVDIPAGPATASRSELVRDTTADQFPFQIDLGQAWNEWTGLPFVFAVWAARPGVDCDRLSHLLSTARDLGLAQTAELARSHAGRYDLSVGDCLRYFTEFLNYRLGPRDKDAMQLFCQWAAESGLLPHPCELKFHGCPVA